MIEADWNGYDELIESRQKQEGNLEFPRFGGHGIVRPLFVLH